MFFQPTLRIEPAAAPRPRRHLLFPGLVLAAVAGAGLGAYSRIQTSTPGHAAGPGLRIVAAPLVAPVTATMAGPMAAAAKASAFTPGSAAADLALASPPRAPAGVAAAPPSQPAVQPSFDCALALGAAETRICADPRLAAADRRMARAWRRAIDAGAPSWRLRRDQRDWLEARNVAAREQPGELADLYDQRIRELEALGPGPTGPDY